MSEALIFFLPLIFLVSVGVGYVLGTIYRINKRDSEIYYEFLENMAGRRRYE